MIAADRAEDTWPGRVVVLARGRLLDPCLAAGFVLVLEIEAATSGHRRGSLVLNMLVVAVMGLASAGRRRAPLAFLAVVGLGAISLSRGLTSTSDHYSTLAGLYCVLIPSYAVGAWEKRKRALFGLGAWMAFAGVGIALQHVAISNLAPGAVTALAAWTAGRVMYAERRLAGELEKKLERLATERADNARLAIASERMRIARELHAVVAQGVAGMVLQAEAAQRLLDFDESSVDLALSSVESTGRGALIEMRRILGALRRSTAPRELDPQPGAGEVHALVQRLRSTGQAIDLYLTGEPVLLPVPIDVGVYRILEEALERAQAAASVKTCVSLRFTENEIEIDVDAMGENSIEWPTPSMRERVVLCGGDLEARYDAGSSKIRICLPTSLHEALA